MKEECHGFRGNPNNWAYPDRIELPSDRASHTPMLHPRDTRHKWLHRSGRSSCRAVSAKTPPVSQARSLRGNRCIRAPHEPILVTPCSAAIGRPHRLFHYGSRGSFLAVQYPVSRSTETCLDLSSSPVPILVPERTPRRSPVTLRWRESIRHELTGVVSRTC